MEIAYLVDVYHIDTLTGFRVAVVEESKKKAIQKLRKIYPYKSYKSGYSLHILDIIKIYT